MDFDIIVHYSDFVGVDIIFVTLKNIFDELKTNRASEFDVTFISVFAPVT